MDAQGRTHRTAQLVAHLRRRTRGVPRWERFLIVNRPRICPFDVLLERIAEGSAVYDFGCGRGAFLSCLQMARAPRRLGGHDIAPAAIARARALLAAEGGRSPAAEVSVLGPDETPALSAYDVVTLIDVLHHWPEGSAGERLRAIGAAMRPGALLLLKDIAGDSPLCAFNKLHDFLISREIGHEIPARRAAELLGGAGFETLSLSRHVRFWYPHYLIEARRA